MWHTILFSSLRITFLSDVMGGGWGGSGQAKFLFFLSIYLSNYSIINVLVIYLFVYSFIYDSIYLKAISQIIYN